MGAHCKSSVLEANRRKDAQLSPRRYGGMLRRYVDNSSWRSRRHLPLLLMFLAELGANPSHSSCCTAPQAAFARSSGWARSTPPQQFVGGFNGIVMHLRGGENKQRSVQTGEKFCKEDQVMLNKYAGLNFRKKELLEQLKETEDEAEGLRGAADEILMAGLDGPQEFQEQRKLPMGIDFRWGETFTEWCPERAQEELDYRTELNQISQDTLNEDLIETEEKMLTIKEHLKGKFGDQVQLDDEDDIDEEADPDEFSAQSDDEQ